MIYVDLFVSELTCWLFNVYFGAFGFKGEQAVTILGRRSPVRVILVLRQTRLVQMR